MNKIILLSIFFIINTAIYSQNFERVPNVDLSSGYNGFASWGDYNSDGLLDIYVTGMDFGDRYRYAEIYTNNGDKTFTLSKINSLPKVIYGDVAWGDYDNNGTLDLIYAGTKSGFSEDNITQIYKNGGQSGFIEINHQLPCLGQCCLEWVDVNNDGLLDIYYQGINSDKEFELGIYKNWGADDFRKENINIESISGARGNGTVNAAKWADFDNDGLKDVIVALSSNDNFEFTFYKNKGNFIFEKIDIGLPQLNYVSMDVGDINQDGLMDVVFSGSTKKYLMGSDQYAKMYVLVNKGSLVFEESQSMYGVDVFQNTLELGDMNNDGYADILYYGSGPNFDELEIYLNNGNRTFNYVSHTIPNVNSGGAFLGDFDNDNDLDILYYGRIKNINTGYDEEVTYVYENKSEIPNTPPQAPQSINILAIDNNLKITCTEGADDSTLASSLFYNISIGTSENPNSLISGNSISKNLLFPHMGNMGQSKAYLYENFPEGNYKIKLQTIDHAFNVSEYSETVEICFKRTSNLLGDTLSICEGDSILIGIDDNYLAYNWNTGSGKSKIYAKKEGLYNLNISHSDGSISSETVYIKEKKRPQLNLGENFSACLGDTVSLKISSLSEIKWNNESTNNTLEVFKTGKYWVDATGDNSCTNSDTISILFYPKPEVDLGEDVTIESTESIILSAYIDNGTYIWNNGTRNAELIVDGNEVGLGKHLFWVKTINEFGCHVTDSITIEVSYVLGIENINKKEDPKIFPNPFKDRIKIHNNTRLRGKTEIKIINIQGKLVFKNTLKSLERDETFILPDMPKGVYFLLIHNQDNDIKKTFKLIK